MVPPHVYLVQIMSTSATRWFPFRLMILTAALAPVAVAAVFHFRGPSAQASRPSERRATLVFDQYSVNWGKVPPAPVIRALYRFTNHGDDTVKITKLEPSCGCITPRLNKKEFAPGESGSFTLQAQTASQKPGPQEMHVIVYYEDPAPKRAKLLFKFDLPAQEKRVAVEPRALIFYHSGQGTPPQDVFVSDTRENPLRVTKAECNAKFVAVEIHETKTKEGGSTLTRLTVAVTKDAPKGSHQPVITIHTDDAQYPAITVPLRVMESGSLMLRKTQP